MKLVKLFCVSDLQGGWDFTNRCVEAYGTELIHYTPLGQRLHPREWFVYLERENILYPIVRYVVNVGDRREVAIVTDESRSLPFNEASDQLPLSPEWFGELKGRVLSTSGPLIIQNIFGEVIESTGFNIVCVIDD